MRLWPPQLTYEQQQKVAALQAGDVVQLVARPTVVGLLEPSIFADDLGRPYVNVKWLTKGYTRSISLDHIQKASALSALGAVGL